MYSPTQPHLSNAILESLFEFRELGLFSKPRGVVHLYGYKSMTQSIVAYQGVNRVERSRGV